MSYQVENGIWSNVFAVPSEVVDKHIKLCGPLSLKVLLVLLRHGGSMEAAVLAELLNQPVADVQDAMNYWVQMGVILQGGAAAPAAPAEFSQAMPLGQNAALVSYQSPESAAPAREEPAVPPQGEPVGIRAAGEEDSPRITKLTRTRQRYSTAEINDMAEEDETIRHLIQETQACLGKPLTPSVTDLVVALYSDYGMQPDLVLMLLHYCVSIGKGNTRYVEKVAESWLESGIDTHEKAEEEIKRRTRQSQVEGRVKKAFGIYDRNLVSSEKKYIATWVEEFHMEMPLIELAFERSVELKGKLSFPYINGILSNWHAAGISSPAQAVKEIQQGKAPGGGKAGKGDASYDMGELEKMINYGDIL